MFSIFKRKTNQITDVNWLGVDIHNHLLPGIDDGAKDVAESILYIKKLCDLGFEKSICTPHIFTELYPNSRETISAALTILKDELVKHDFEFKISAAAEYMIDDSFKVESGLLTLPENYLLIEMSYLNETPNIEQIVFDLQIKGYHIILAHPERYKFYHKTHNRYHRLRDMGCLFQLNLLSAVGYYGKGEKQAFEYLLSEKLYEFAGTDLHHSRHLDVLEKVIRSGELYKLIGHYDFKNRNFNG